MGARVEEILAEIRASDPALARRAEELVGLLVDMYGEGLFRVCEHTAGHPDGVKLIERMADDPLLASLFLLHGLHPEPVEDRIERALNRVRPALGGKELEVVSLGEDGRLRLRLSAPLEGCPSTAGSVHRTIEENVTEWAPEVREVLIEGLLTAVTTAEPKPVPVSIGRRPPRPAGVGG